MVSMDGKLILQGIKGYCWKNSICKVSYLEQASHTTPAVQPENQSHFPSVAASAQAPRPELL